jgi:hypothetical protein
MAIFLLRDYPTASSRSSAFLSLFLCMKLSLRVCSFKLVFEKRDRKSPLRVCLLCCSDCHGQVVKFSPDNKTLAVGSDDETVDFYSVGDFKQTAFCKNLGGAVLHIDWSVDSKYVRIDTSKFEVHAIEVATAKLCKTPDVCVIFQLGAHSRCRLLHGQAPSARKRLVCGLPMPARFDNLITLRFSLRPT